MFWEIDKKFPYCFQNEKFITYYLLSPFCFLTITNFFIVTIFITNLSSLVTENLTKLLCSLPLGHVRQKNQVCHLSRGKIITDYLSKKLHILSKSTNLVSFKINVYLNFICLGERQINHIFRFHHEDWWFAWCVAIAFFRSALGLWL